MITLLRIIAMVLPICFLMCLPDSSVASPSDKDSKPPSEKKTDDLSAQDHSEFEELQEEFGSGPEVTEACLGCHGNIADEIQQSHHWTWSCPSKRKYKVGQSGYTINNTSISPIPNTFSCYKCHISYRWEDYSLSLGSPENIDCLICHEQSNGLYDEFRKEWNPFLNKIAQQIGKPSNRNCGACHFYRSGGDGALRGDLSSKLLNASRDIDVHMDVNGPDLDCIDCHITHNHTISGRCYENSAKISNSENKVRYDCTYCHKHEDLHKSIDKINDHIDRVACQTCHIPLISKDLFSRVWQDYSKAGKTKDGRAYTIHNEQGKKIYSTRYGEWQWSKNIKPEYFWSNGGFAYTLVTDKIDPSQEVMLNYTNTGYSSYQAKIYPFKVHRGKQPYDKVNNTMVIPKLTDRNKSSGAYWIEYDWNKAIKAGMDEVGLSYGGEYGFVETAYLYPIHHMVVPKEKALKCSECHTRENGRLEKLSGFYMPGRDRSLMTDYGGLLCILVAISGVLLHAFFAFAKRDIRGGQ